MTSYTAIARPAGRMWHVEVPEVKRSTQARRPGEIAEMAADLVVCMTGEEAAPSDIQVEFVLPEAIQEHLNRMRQARIDEEQARSTVLAEQKAAALALTDLGYSRRDAGAVLGVSHQRVQQLIDA